MPKYIEVGQEVIEFPDSMSDADIEKVLASQFSSPAPTAASETPAPKTKEPKKSVWEEAGRQVGLTARAGIQAAANIPLLVAEPLAAGVNYVAGKEVFPNQRQALQQFLTDVGLPAPQNKLERAVQAGAEAVGGVGGQAKLVQAAGSKALAPLTKQLGQQGVAAGAGASAAQATAERAQEVGLDPVSSVAATLAVGTLAGLAGAKGVRVATAQKAPQITMDQVKQDASRAYTRVDDAGITVKPQPLLNALDDIESNLLKGSNFNPQLDTHKPVAQVLQQIRAMVGTERVSFTKLDQMRQAAASLARESKEPATRRLAAQIVEGIDKKITTLQPNELMSGKNALPSALKDVKEARESWKRVSKATVLEDALNVAEARALDPKASEGELIRTQFKALAANKDKMRMFNKDEQAMIREVVGGRGGQKILSLLARFNPERSQLMTGATIGASISNPLAAGAVALTGLAADKALGVVQRKAAQDVIAKILAGQIQPPKNNVQWRALVEAQARSYDNPLEAPQ